MFGVRAPALAEREPDGSVHVYDGQLRVLLAREVGLRRVPVWITDADPAVDDNERRIARTIDQINLNDRRIPLLDADRASGVALTLELGASATRVAEGLQRKRSEITKTAAIGASPTAKRLLMQGRQLDLDQLAIIADYERRGDTDAVARLERAGRYDFTYVPTWTGFVYVAFVIDCFARTIAGWHAATIKDTAMVTSALKMALWRRDHDGHAVEDGLIHHSDAGSPNIRL